MFFFKIRKENCDIDKCVKKKEKKCYANIYGNSTFEEVINTFETLFINLNSSCSKIHNLWRLNDHFTPNNKFNLKINTKSAKFRLI